MPVIQTNLCQRRLFFTRPKKESRSVFSDNPVLSETNRADNSNIIFRISYTANSKRCICFILRAIRHFVIYGQRRSFRNRCAVAELSQ